jgi:hypothetical protein
MVIAPRGVDKVQQEPLYGAWLLIARPKKKSKKYIKKKYKKSMQCLSRGMLSLWETQERFTGIPQLDLPAMEH